MIQTTLGMGLKPAVMARSLDRSGATLARELRRNGWVRPLGRHRPGRPPVAGGTRAEAVRKGLSHVLNRIESQKRLSLTDDQGRERAEHRGLTQATGVKVTLADPKSPWQRGIHANTHGLLRKVLPRGSDPSGFTQEALDAIAWKPNTRPRSRSASSAPLRGSSRTHLISGSITLRSLHWVCETALLAGLDYNGSTHFPKSRRPEVCHVQNSCVCCTVRQLPT